MSQEKLKDLRNAFGSFLTGVTVVTAREKGGIPRGFTANSFTSVSLDPPLLLICVDKSAESIEVFTESPGFAVNILSEDQKDISGLFASKRVDKFDIVQWYESKTGYPLIEGVCAWFNCERERVVDAGDHVVIFGRIIEYRHNEKIGLGYVRGGYLQLGLEQSAIKAVAENSNVVVGVIVEKEGKILLIDDQRSGELHLPASGFDGTPGSMIQVQQDLGKMGIAINVSSLFAVFEHEQSGQQFIYYRAKSSGNAQLDKFWDPNLIPWNRIHSSAVITMLKRYISEAQSGRYGVYFGGHRDGSVKSLSD